MDKKIIVMALGLILLIAGTVAMLYTEPAGEEGSDPSRGIADLSEDIRPYFWYGVIIILLGIIMLAMAVIKIP